MIGMLQFDPSLWVETPLGPGLALFVIDYGMHQNTCWVIALENQEGTIKHFDANDIKLLKNHTYNIGK